MLVFVTSIARNANGYFVYPFAYLVLEQEYLCDASGTGVFESCTKEQICEENLTIKVDTTQEFYLKNWQIEMGLVCMP